MDFGKIVISMADQIIWNVKAVEPMRQKSKIRELLRITLIRNPNVIFDKIGSV
jgi:hypothetical protein